MAGCNATHLMDVETSLFEEFLVVTLGSGKRAIIAIYNEPILCHILLHAYVAAFFNSFLQDRPAAPNTHFRRKPSGLHEGTVHEFSTYSTSFKEFNEINISQVS